METPLETVVRAMLDGVRFDALDGGNLDAATVSVVPGSAPIPTYFHDALKRDGYAVKWAVCHLGGPGSHALNPAEIISMLHLLGSGHFRRFVHKRMPSTVFVLDENTHQDGKRG